MSKGDINGRNLRYLKGSIFKGRISANDIIITLLFVVLALAPLFLSDFRTNLLGKFIAYAILALGIDSHMGLYRNIKFGAWSLFWTWCVLHGNVLET